jgi:hypothetical protein
MLYPYGKLISGLQKQIKCWMDGKWNSLTHRTHGYINTLRVLYKHRIYSVTCLLYLSLLNTKFDVLGTENAVRILNSFITTSLVVTTISFRMCSDPLTLHLWAVLIPLLWSFDLAWGSALLICLPLWSGLIWSGLVWSGMVSYLLQSGGLEDFFLEGFVSRVSVAADFNNSVA